MVSAQNIYPDPGSWLPNVPGRWAPAGFSCGGPGHSRQSLGPVGTGGWEGEETSLSFPSIPATLGFGEPPKMKPAQHRLLCTLSLSPCSWPLEEAPRSVTLSFFLNFARPPSLRCPWDGPAAHAQLGGIPSAPRAEVVCGMEQSKQEVYFFFQNMKFPWNAALCGETVFNCYHSCCFLQEKKVHLHWFLKQISKSHIDCWERRCSQTWSGAESYFVWWPLGLF